MARLVISKEFFFDEPKRCERTLIFLGPIMPSSDTLFDSSQAERVTKSISLSRGRLSSGSLPLISVPILPEAHIESGVRLRAE